MQEDFDKTVAKMSAAKPEIMDRQMKLLAERYDLSDRPAKGVAMSRGKPIQEGVRAKLPDGREVVGRTGRHDARGDSREGAVARRVPALAASQSPGRRHGVSASIRSTRSRSRKDAT